MKTMSRTKGLRQIAASLGFKIKRAPGQRKYVLVCEASRVVRCSGKVFNSVFTDFKNYKDLEHGLFNAIKDFIVHSSGYGKMTCVIKNPYLGCESLEEAMIRKDLLLGERGNG